MALEYINIGKIVGIFGNLGQVRIFPLTDFPERFLTMKEVLVLNRGERKAFQIKEAYSYKKHVIIQFEEVTDMNTAESLKGAFLQITRQELTPLPEDSFYIFDLIGLDVFNEEGAYLGTVEDVIRTGANDVYVVATEKKRPLLIPALKQVVRQVDLKNQRMVVELLPGLDEDLG